jgi:hypothetical protein
MSLSSQVGSAMRIGELEPSAAPGLGYRILISIPTGFQLRQFVHSGVVDLLLRRGFQILIVSPNREGEGFTRHLPKQGLAVRTLPLKRGRLSLRYWAARQHLLLKGPPTDTLRQKMINLRGRYPSVALAAQVGNHLLRRIPRLRQGVLRWEHLIMRNEALEALLSTEAVDLILL